MQNPPTPPPDLKELLWGFLLGLLACSLITLCASCSTPRMVQTEVLVENHQKTDSLSRELAIVRSELSSRTSLADARNYYDSLFTTRTAETIVFTDTVYRQGTITHYNADGGIHSIEQYTQSSRPSISAERGSSTAIHVSDSTTWSDAYMEATAQNLNLIENLTSMSQELDSLRSSRNLATGTHRSTIGERIACTTIGILLGIVLALLYHIYNRKQQ